MKYKRIFVIVTDSMGVGEASDAANYDDVGSNTLTHLSYSKIDFNIPNLKKLGIGHITQVNNTPSVDNPLGIVGKMHELSVGKDTLTGHWEMMGLEVLTPFPSFTDNGFPDELINEIEKQTGFKVIGNKSASGTEIIKELGERQLKTGELIVYTSADSVLQIAAHEEKIPLEKLYETCSIVRKITLSKKEWMVGRIIARPFIGTNKDDFIRTPNRHDYSVKPSGETVLNFLQEKGFDVISVGKIKDIFDGEGITEAHKIKSNKDGMDNTIEIAKKDFTGLCFVNLVDFDALYGHRRNAIGYANCVEEFDLCLGELLPLIKNDDLLMICADHGNDPTFHGTDHTREYVPIILYSPTLKGKYISDRKTFADIGATISKNFDIRKTNIGKAII